MTSSCETKRIEMGVKRMNEIHDMISNLSDGGKASITLTLMELIRDISPTVWATKFGTDDLNARFDVIEILCSAYQTNPSNKRQR